MRSLMRIGKCSRAVGGLAAAPIVCTGLLVAPLPANAAISQQGSLGAATGQSATPQTATYPNCQYSYGPSSSEGSIPEVSMKRGRLSRLVEWRQVGLLSPCRRQGRRGGARPPVGTRRALDAGVAGGGEARIMGSGTQPRCGPWLRSPVSWTEVWLSSLLPWSWPGSGRWEDSLR
jgi:hypothetical protein